MIDIEAVRGNLRQRGAGSLLRVFGRSFKMNVPEIFLGYEKTDAGNSAGYVQDLVIEELIGRGRQKITRVMGRLKTKII